MQREVYNVSLHLIIPSMYFVHFTLETRLCFSLNTYGLTIYPRYLSLGFLLDPRARTHLSRFPLQMSRISGDRPLGMASNTGITMNAILLVGKQLHSFRTFASHF